MPELTGIESKPEIACRYKFVALLEKAGYKEYALANNRYALLMFWEVSKNCLC